jgi:type IV pilus assembly protein PilC
MPLIVTPGQFTKRSHFYYQLAQLTSAGLGVVPTLQQIQRAPPSRAYVRPIQSVVEDIGAGCTFTEAVRRVRNWLPEFDTALLQAGEHSGRIDQCFRLLADYYNERARLARQLISDLAYPVALFHFAIFILPFAQLFSSGNWLRYLAQTFGVLIPLYVLVTLLIYATQSRHGERWRGWVEAILRPIPMLGTARHCLALSRLAGALEALLGAGVTIIEAWELAANACGSPALRKAVLGWRPLVDGGQTPAEALSTSRRFPELFTGQYATGEVSGKLEETLQRLRDYYQEEGSRKLRTISQWTPKAVYLFVMLMIAYRVVKFWMGYFKQISDIGGF